SLKLIEQVSSGSHLENRSDILYRQCRRVVLKQTRHPFLVDGDISGIPQMIELESAKGGVKLVLPGDTTTDLERP
ncbi:MAG: hypothetical protein AAEJ04_08540, partial [Planctomycetota bacterium]